MKILCVEDGSIDIEKVEIEGLKDGDILVYRQGSNKPYVLEIDDNFNVEKERIYKAIINAEHKWYTNHITYETTYKITDVELRKILYSSEKSTD